MRWTLTLLGLGALVYFARAAYEDTVEEWKRERDRHRGAWWV